MTSFTDKDIEGLKQCPVCEMWSNLGFCWKCEPYKLTSEDDYDDRFDSCETEGEGDNIRYL